MELSQISWILPLFRFERLNDIPKRCQLTRRDVDSSMCSILPHPEENTAQEHERCGGDQNDAHCLQVTPPGVALIGRFGISMALFGPQKSPRNRIAIAADFEHVIVTIPDKS